MLDDQDVIRKEVIAALDKHNIEHTDVKKYDLGIMIVKAIHLFQRAKQVRRDCK